MPTDIQLVGQSTEALTGSYRFDPAHSRFGFVARHAMVTKVRGRFAEFEGGLEVDGSDPASSSGWLKIQGLSIDTGNEQRDEHIRSNDFLALGEYPEISFATTSISGVGDRYHVTGDLTVRDATRPVTFDVTYLGTAVDPWGNTRIGFEGSAVVNRKDWGVNWNTVLEAGGVLVSEKVTLEFEVAAIKS